MDEYHSAVKKRAASTSPRSSADRRSSIATMMQEEMNKEELLRKLEEYRKANIELLEDKRHLLLRSQEAYKTEVELRKTESELQQLKERVKFLEASPQANVQKITNNTIKEIVRQLSNTSKNSEEKTILNYQEEGNQSDREEVFVGFEDNTTYKREGLRLPVTKMDGSDIQRTCSCGLKDKYSELVKINHFWQKDYTTLMEDYNNTKARLWRAESEMAILKQENEDLALKLATTPEPAPRVNGALQETDLFTLDDIEALKQQLLIYKEDYNAEKEDNKKLVVQQNKLKLEVQKAYGIIDSLTLKNTKIKENFRRVSCEKEHIIMELRRLSTSGLPFSPVINTNSTFGTVGTMGRRVASDETIDTLLSEDVIAHSRSSHHVPYTPTYVRDYVERDSHQQIKRKLSSPLYLPQTRTSPPTIQGRISPTNHTEGRTSPVNLPRGSPPSNHIDIKELPSISENMRSL